MKKAAMKKSIILAATCFTVFVSSTGVAFAATSTTAPDVAATTAAGVTTTTATTTAVTTGATTGALTTTAAAANVPVSATTGGSITIAPDSVLYPLKLMVESVQTALTFTPEGKAELLVSFANKRLAEADLMTDKNKQKLVLSVMQAYVKTINSANEKAQEAATTQTSQDVKPILDNIQITEQSADNFVIKVTGTVPQNISDQLKTVVADQVKMAIVKEAAAAAKDKVKEASQQVKLAKEQLAIAQKAGNDTLVKSATDALTAAQKSKDDASALKDQTKAYKKAVVRSINQQEAAAGITSQKKEDGDENDKSDEHGDKSDKHKDNEKYQKHHEENDNDRNDNQHENGHDGDQDNQGDQDN